MHAAEDDDVGTGSRGLLRKPEGIAHEVGHVLDLGDLVIMGEDDGVELLFEGEDVARERVELRERQRPAHFEPVHAAQLGLGQIDHAEKLARATGPRNLCVRGARELARYKKERGWRATSLADDFRFLEGRGGT